MDKAKLVEKLKNSSPEERAVLREALMEIEPPDPDSVLSPEDISFVRTLREKAANKKRGKGTSFLDSLDSLFE